MAKYALLFAITIACFAYINAVDVVTDYYTCPNGPSSEVILFDENNMTCPEKHVCNYKYVKISEKIPRACRTPGVVCKYECTNENVATVNEVDFTCPEYYKCNDEYDSCQMCVPKPCDESQYYCKDAITVVFENGLEMQCPTDTICNLNYIFPCLPCINSTFTSMP